MGYKGHSLASIRHHRRHKKGGEGWGVESRENSNCSESERNAGSCYPPAIVTVHHIASLAGIKYRTDEIGGYMAALIRTQPPTAQGAANASEKFRLPF